MQTALYAKPNNNTNEPPDSSHSTTPRNSSNVSRSPLKAGASHPSRNQQNTKRTTCGDLCIRPHKPTTQPTNEHFPPLNLQSLCPHFLPPNLQSLSPHPLPLNLQSLSPNFLPSNLQSLSPHFLSLNMQSLPPHFLPVIL